jgi:hypothetical protein
MPAPSTSAWDKTGSPLKRLHRDQMGSPTRRPNGFTPCSIGPGTKWAHPFHVCTWTAWLTAALVDYAAAAAAHVAVIVGSGLVLARVLALTRPFPSIRPRARDVATCSPALRLGRRACLLLMCVCAVRQVWQAARCRALRGLLSFTPWTLSVPRHWATKARFVSVLGVCLRCSALGGCFRSGASR